MFAAQPIEIAIDERGDLLGREVCSSDGEHAQDLLDAIVATARAEPQRFACGGAGDSSRRGARADLEISRPGTTSTLR